MVDAAAFFGVVFLVVDRVGIGFGFIVAVRVGIGFLVGIIPMDALALGLGLVAA
ncbi:hypothetical protein [Streptomyces malaysiense]|uniref:hypothetical protein n=1 Tax=Streptomyces malaysiense TaxID=1428626 RepID=UPI00142D83FA|nr:hypothetical protein [Streptomyces malaysiense]